jgi:hypothetical protein
MPGLLLRRFDSMPLERPVKALNQGFVAKWLA